MGALPDLEDSGLAPARRRSFPRAVQAAFGIRRRGILHFGTELESECVPDDDDSQGRETERCSTTLTLRVDGRSVIVRVQAWHDRWLWVDARHSSAAGWRWEFTVQGRFLPSQGARAVVTRVEKMLRAAHLAPAQAPQVMAEIWSKSLAAGHPRVF